MGSEKLFIATDWSKKTTARYVLIISGSSLHHMLHMGNKAGYLREINLLS